ncbi:NAD-dependent epimerase/dehydratase family protein [Desulfosudis oleivorans]|uniref:NAD-dependent epimerase/dehydratase n=1 Tax=Desulfosudis oleivorans (strain DSM 6200 / JCM 39069 / Hxd3) TaxID=96561 RepID=A8ZUG5_DESOH|nr:NAD(P)-dependent oxidoreductase [Desulfosudis oleivorans]ABW67997.1 NAD-dependent epimerase/dehydratase [Desulfosudis oleivorans Hxd3]
MNSSKQMAQPVLVTGATGFIGSQVVHKLLEQDMAVKALVLPDEALPAAWGDRVEVVRGGISESGAVAKAVSGAGTIIHLAAVVSDWGDEKKYWEFTVEGSRLVFEQAAKTGARVVLVSSVVVYGDNVRKQVCHEDVGYGKTFGPYSRTKQAQEKLAWEYHRKKNLALTVVRPGNVYGPRSGPWLHDVVNVLRSGAPGLISGGNMNAGLAYVDNVADLFLLAGASDTALGRAYNAADGTKVTWRRYFEDIAAMIGAKKPGSVPRPAAALSAFVFEKTWKLFGIQKRPPVTRDALNLVGSDNRFPIDRARKELGYAPKVSYEEGLKRIREYIDKESIR